MSFFSGIYSSWTEIQNEKYLKMLEVLKKEKIKLYGKKKILDIGCGPFYFEKFLEERGISSDNFTCIDTEPQKVRDRNFLMADGGHLPFRDSSFSIIFCIDSLHLIPDASDIRRVMKKNGHLIAASFFNLQNQKLIETGMEKKLNRFKILRKTILKGRENELIMLCRK